MTSVGSDARHSNNLEKALPTMLAQDAEINNPYFHNAKSTNSIKAASLQEPKNAMYMAATPKTQSTGQKQLRLNNVQINAAANKVAKKKKFLEGGSDLNQQPELPTPAPIRLSGKNLVAQKQPKVILTAHPLAQGTSTQSGIQRVKQNLIRVKQAQIDFDKQQK